MIVPTITLKKEKEIEICLMVFPLESEELYEFHLVKFEGERATLLKKEVYSRIDIKEIAEDFGVSDKEIELLIRKLYKK